LEGVSIKTNHTMRKIVLLLMAVIGTISFSSAQKATATSTNLYRHVSVAFNFGHGKHGSEPGKVSNFEPAYSFGNNKLGVRFEAGSFDMRDMESYVFTYERYLFNKGELRLSLGGGIGHYDARGAGGCMASPNPVGQDHVEHAMKNFGGMFRANIKFWHLQLGAEYNIVPPTIASNVTSEGKTTGSVSHANNYSTLYLGFVIGGGKKKVTN
jgi:hypothetical protein